MAAEIRKGKLFLIPTPLGEDGEGDITERAKEIIGGLKHFLVEKTKPARRALRSMGIKSDFDEIVMLEMGKQASPDDLIQVVQWLESGHDVGLMSDAGSPVVADPGSDMVMEAHAIGAPAVPLTGPNSIILALMASGLSGQRFAFNGYLPIQEKERVRAVKELERRAASGQTQIFMEAPYRNNQLLKTLVRNCHHDTILCVAVNLTLPHEFISTKEIGKWKKELPDLNKRPAVFLLGR